KGGNEILTQQRKNLHSLWDGLPGNNITVRSGQSQSFAFLHDRELAAVGQAASTALDVDTWLKESFELAQSNVYTTEVISHIRILEAARDPHSVPKLKLSPEYLKTSGDKAKERVVQAGFRLGELLKQIAN